MSHSIEPWIAILKQWQTQLLVTGFALFVYFAGFHIPLPFMPQEMASNVQLPKPFSVFASGLSSWVYAVSATELLLLIFPRLWMDLRPENRHANPFGQWVIAFALIISFFQGIGLANSMAALAESPSANGFQSLFPPAISMAAGLAIVIVLAGLIERSGIGFGIWVILAAGAISSFARGVTEVPIVITQGDATYRNLLIWGILMTLIIAALVSLVMLHQRKSQDPIGILIWPWMLADLFLAPIFAALQFILPFEWSGFMFSHSGFFFTLVDGVLVLGFVTIYSSREKLSALKWLTLIVLALVWTATNFYERWFPPYFPTLNVFALTLLAFACVNIFNQYIEHQRKIAMAKAFRPRTHL